MRQSVSGPTRAMLEAWSTSAKDGSLECLVQVPVILRPDTLNVDLPSPRVPIGRSRVQFDP